MNKEYSVIIIGGGPAGLSAACGVPSDQNVLIIEREARLGGILKQCIHDGFGVVRFGEKLSGPEYAYRFTRRVMESPNITVSLLTFVLDITAHDGIYTVKTTSREGICHFDTKNLILANGCRERTARQIGIHGTRPQGVMTAGVAQNFVNLQGCMPVKRCVILGSGDIGLIMARRLTLEGAQVLGVYEAKSTPSGLTRNIQQCLVDFDIPLYLSHTVTRIFGEKRVEAVEIAEVDERMVPISGTEQRIECDGLVISVGLIPENELAEGLGICIDRATRGPVVDQHMMTELQGVYSVGNALHVHDLVDYVSETAETAAAWTVHNSPRQLVNIHSNGFLYLVPQMLDVASLADKTTFYFRAAKEMKRACFTVSVDGQQIFSRVFTNVKPPEMERVQLPVTLRVDSNVEFSLEEA